MTYYRSLFAAGAGALALIAAPAIAQVYYDKQVYDDEIVVVAPGVHREPTGRRTSIGAPIVDLTTQRVVTTAGLDLRYDADADELYRRIDDSVRDACNELERASQGAPVSTRRDCIRDAQRDAHAQADALIYARRG
ncbi:MAG: UrcA family protein [Hyphomonadaceae bacterium]